MSNYNELKITYQGGSQETITLAGNTIEYGAYQYRNIVAVEVPEIVQTIGGYAFCDNNNLANIVLNEGLQTIEGQAFQHGVYSAVTIPSTVENIGWNAFNIFDEQDGGTAGNLYITCLASTPPRLEAPDKTFGNPDLLTIYVPAESVELYKANWGGYADKIQAIPTPTPITTLDITTAYIGDTEVTKLYLGDNLVWGGTDNSKKPLTFKVLSAGTIYWKTNNANIAKTITYKKNNGEWTSVTSTTAGTPIDVAVGDVVRFRGNNPQYGSDESTFARNSFSGSTAIFEVEGNIMSLLYDNSFVGQTELESANTFYRLFERCWITSAENLVLPATTLKYRCYCSLFNGSGLITPPELPATTLTDDCYYSMFEGCSYLRTAPELPATSLTEDCYNKMFYNCISLTEAPYLPATTLAPYCYNNMFYGCSNLTGIRCHAIDISATGCTTNWVSGVSSTGTFIKHAAGVWPIGDNGVPSGWSGQVVYDSTTYGEYFTCEMLESGYFTIAEMKYGSHIYTTDVDYSLNGGEWHTITITNDGYVFSVSAGDKIRFRGTNTSYGHDSKLHVSFGVAKNDTTYQTLSQLTTTSFNVYGNIMSLLYGDNFSDARSLPSGATGFTFCSLFKNSSIVDASGLILPATGLSPSCYRAMFSKADRLTKSPLFPAENNLASLCYNYLFEKCTALTHIACFATRSTSIAGFSTGVTSEGVFYKNPNASWSNGATGIPNGWTVIDAE